MIKTLALKLIQIGFIHSLVSQLKETGRVSSCLLVAPDYLCH